MDELRGEVTEVTRPWPFQGVRVDAPLDKRALTVANDGPGTTRLILSDPVPRSWG